MFMFRWNIKQEMTVLFCFRAAIDIPDGFCPPTSAIASGFGASSCLSILRVSESYCWQINFSLSALYKSGG
jgi:hypothetical protein